MAKCILFVGGGIETLPGVKLAQEMGLHVLVSDRNPNAPCFDLAQDRLLADTYNAQASLLLAQNFVRRSRPIDGVICMGSDIPWSCAVISAGLGLPGLDLVTAALSADKLAMKQTLRAAGVAVPFFAPLESADDLRRVISQQGLPLVVKPVDSRGARGVIRTTSQVDPQWAFEYAQRCSPTARVMVEAYLAGPQLSSESLVINGVTCTPGMSDRNYALLDKYAPFFIEDGGDLPSCLAPQMLAQVRDLVHRAGKALGLVNGVLKGDIVVSDGKPYIIEVATRLSGGYFCSHTIPMNTGVELVRFALLQALGESIDPRSLQPIRNEFVCQRYLFPKPGKVSMVQGEAEARAMPGISYLETRVAPGDVVAPIENHPARAGVLMATGSSREEAIRNAEAAVAMLQIKTTP